MADLSKKKRESIYNITNGKCFYCGCDLDIENFHADHFVPKCKGGIVRNNLVPSCAECNMCKGGLSVEDFRRKIENLTTNSFAGKMISKYAGINKLNIKFYYEEVENGYLQNRINDILDRP